MTTTPPNDPGTTAAEIHDWKAELFDRYRGSDLYRPVVVAVDGPAGSGKSSVSRAAAKALGFGYQDTGAAYRAFALHAVEAGADLADADSIVAALASFDYAISTDPDHVTVLVSGRDVTEEIRTPGVTTSVASVAKVPAVRSRLVELFRSVIASTEKPGIVTEGRDITTVVAPDAPVRILLTASEEARMARRSAEVTGQSAEETARQLVHRDRQDSKVVDFMTAAEGVTTLDSTHLDFDQTVHAVVELVHASAAASTNTP